jgi:hypothetical protein
MAKRLALGACDQLHHFIAAGVWDATPVETELLVQADGAGVRFGYVLADALLMRYSNSRPSWGSCLVTS